MDIIIELDEIKSYFDQSMLFWNSKITNVLKVSHEEYIESITKHLKDEELIKIIQKSSEKDNIFFQYKGKKLEEYKKYNFLKRKVDKTKEELLKLKEITLKEFTSEEMDYFIEKIENYDLEGGLAESIIKRTNYILSILDKDALLSEKELNEIKVFSICFKSNIIGAIIKKYQTEKRLDEYPFIHVGEEIDIIMESIQNLYNRKNIENEIFYEIFYEINEKNLRREIRNKIFYLYFFYIMYLMLESPFLKKEEEKQLKKLYDLFYDNMHDSEILCLKNEFRYFNENLEIENRGKTDKTTRLTIIFCRGRLNIYKLRLDLSHKGVEFHHVNLMNSNVKEFIFITKKEEEEVKKEIREEDFKKIFIHTNDFNFYTFRNECKEFIEQLPTDKKKILKSLYEKKSHKFIEMELMPSKNIYKILEESFGLLSSNNTLTIKELESNQSNNLLFLESYKEYQYYLDVYLKLILDDNIKIIDLKKSEYKGIITAVSFLEEMKIKWEKLEVDKKLLGNLKRLKENTIESLLRKENYNIAEIEEDILEIDIYFQNFKGINS